MQIRVANRQDEPIIRTIVNQVNAELGAAEIDLKGSDSDLNNIESHYFWHDGIFVVAEDNGLVVGLGGARRGESDKQLELVRLVVIPSRRNKGTAVQLLQTIEFFGQNSEYDEVVYSPKKFGTTQNEPFFGFTVDGATWNLALKRRSVC